MTSPQIAALRKALGFTTASFASLLGVSPSTVTRWDTAPPVDAGTLGLLMVLAECFEKKPSAERKVFAESIDRAFSVGGRNKALHVILCDHYGTDATEGT